jgi:hypothetical protein
MQKLIDDIWNYGVAHRGDLVCSFVSASLSTLVGAFVGAFIAFKKERSKAMDDQKAANRDAMIRAQIILFCHLESLENIKRYLQPMKEGMMDATNLNEFGYVFNSDSISVSSLSFLVEHDEATLILRLHRSGKAYKNTCDAITDWNIKVRELRSVVSTKNEFNQHAAYYPQVKLLQDTSKNMFASIDIAILEITGCMEDNRLIAKRLFKGSNFPRIGALEPKVNEADKPK